MKRINWDDLKVVTALARGGSVRAAATAMGVHHSTVIRRLAEVEAQLATKLFDRTPEGLELSEPGRLVLAKTERVEVEIAAIERAMLGRDERLAGEVRITFPDAMGVGFLMHELGAFIAEYPEIAVEFIASNSTLNLGRREADVAIRVTETPPEHLIGRRLGGFTLAAYASRMYLDSHDPIGEPELCNWIGADNGAPMSDHVRNTYFPTMPSRVTCTSVLLQMAAAQSSAGIALLPCALGDGQPDLVRVAPDEPVEGPPIWLLMHTDVRNSARVQAVVRWIVAAFARNKDLMMGRGSSDTAAGPKALCSPRAQPERDAESGR